MKRELVLSSLFVAACLCSCTDDEIIDNKVVDNPVQEGTEILFGSTLSKDALGEMPETKTVYGERTSTGVPVYWSPDGDEVAIFCAQASQPADRLVNYKVYPQDEETGDPSLSASVEKLEEVGLQWGSDDEHRFYAFYPASAVKAADEDDQNGIITAEIPVTQSPVDWVEGELNGKKTYFGLPNMNYAYMYAFTSQKKSETPEGTNIDLHFKNLVTVIDITVQGPAENSTPITVTNINISAVDGKNVILTGEFNCNIRTAEDNSEEVTANCTAAGDLNEVRNTVSIPCYENGELGISLSPGEQLNVKAYIIPDDDENHTIEPRQLQITVATLEGAAKRKTLQTADVVPHKINRVLLPLLEAGGVNYWMSSLDPRIYVTELSWPGSKMSLLTEANNADIVYQSTTIAEQLKDGVRAFIFQTQRRTSGWGTNEEMVLTANGNVIETSLADGLKQIADFLNEAEQQGKRESAFVLVTYNGGDGSQKDWMDLLQQVVNTCANNDSYRIFKEDLSPNTTLGDVANQIIVKANYNTTDMISGVGTAPMLYTIWQHPYVGGGLPMTWNNPNGSSSFTWLYQEVTSVLDPARNKCNADGNGEWWDGTTPYSCESTKDQKETYIRTIFEESVEAYKNNEAHNIWFMNDLGGYYGYCTNNNHRLGNDDHEEYHDVVGLTKYMNNLGVRLLQERTENAGLGLVYMNFANRNSDGQEYRSDWLIQTVIDNNFKFQLRLDDSKQINTLSTKAIAAGGAGWDE